MIGLDAQDLDVDIGLASLLIDWWMNGWMDRFEGFDGWMDRFGGWMGLMDKWMDGWMDEWMDWMGLMDEWMDG